MARSSLTAVGLASLSALSLGAFSIRPADAQPETSPLKAALAGASSVEVREIPLPDEAVQRLAAALGDRFDAASDGKPALAVAATLPNPLDDTEKLERAYAIATAAGTLKTLVVAYPDPAQDNRLVIAAVRILAPASPSEGLRRFAERLGWKTLGPCAWESPATLASIRAAAETASDDVASQNQLLLRLARDMQEMDFQLDRIKSGHDRDAPAAAAELLRLYEATQALYERAGFVFKGGPADQTREIAVLRAQNEKALDEARALQTAVAAGDLAKARRRAGSLSCAKCHGIALKPFQTLRAERKIGNGYFEPGLDLPGVAEADAIAARDLATAVRKALLLIELSRN